MSHTLLDYFFPKKSLTGSEGEFVTAEEMADMQFEPVLLNKESLQNVGVQYIDRVAAATRYDGRPLLKRAIHTFKYKRLPAVSDCFGKALERASQLLWGYDVDPMLSAIPLHWTRQFWRGFNQAELLANQVSYYRKCPVRVVLKRVRPTGHQAWRNRSERLVAMNKAFTFIYNSIPERVILVDDLFTTGATMDACAKVLKEAGVAKVEGLVLALG